MPSPIKRISTVVVKTAKVGGAGTDISKTTSTLSNGNIAECPPVPSCPECVDGTWVIGEIPAGNVDGINNLFQTNDVFLPTSLRVYHNGLKLQWEEIDLNTGNPLFFILNYIPDTGDVITVDYIIQA